MPCALVLALDKAGSNMPARMAMIAMTTRSSISVNPLSVLRQGLGGCSFCFISSVRVTVKCDFDSARLVKQENSQRRKLQYLRPESRSDSWLWLRCDLGQNYSSDFRQKAHGFGYSFWQFSVITT